MSEFKHSLARLAVWNLAGYNQSNPAKGIGPNTQRAKNQAEGLALLDAELVTLVEVSPISHINRLASLLSSEYNLAYDHTILQLPNGNIHIGFLHKEGVEVSNFHHLGGDDLMDFVSSWDLQDRFSHILDKGRANLLDGFAVSRTYSTDYVRGSLRLFPMHWTMGRGREAFKKEVSDHLPFVASFRIF